MTGPLARGCRAAAGLLLALPALGDDAPAWAARAPGAGAPRIAVAAPRDPRFAHLAWPKAVRAPDGTIVVACLAGIFHGAHGGTSPAVSFSTDDGRTFSPPAILRAFEPDGPLTASGNLALGVAGDGALVLLAMAYRGDEANDLFGWRSGDGGRTWQPVDTSSLGPNRTGSVTGGLHDLPGRGLLVFGHYRKGSSPHTQGIWMAASTNQGRSWGEPARISDVAGAEPVFVRAKDRWLVFIRGAEGNTRQWVAVSDDRGATWRTTVSDPCVEDPRRQTLAHPCAVVDPQRPEELLLLATQRPLPGGIWLWRGDPATLAWRRERAVLEFPKIPGDAHGDFGYPWLVHRAGNRWLLFYYHGLIRGPSAIWAADVEL